MKSKYVYMIICVVLCAVAFAAITVMVTRADEAVSDTNTERTAQIIQRSGAASRKRSTKMKKGKSR